ncbi:hypothetical protein TRIUR3_20739 [Triticum urartu]|uniref:DUF3615 domain-containing protein n=1 Tax=Triticum urartu TaxID=4572 RepID=M7ZIR5_TRIUA|nr:hypothetical protein TRIUR3_20739 [Triticum urartu]
MSVDDCSVPFHSPFREPTAYDRWGKSPQPCWSQLDLDKCALGGSQGRGGVDRHKVNLPEEPKQHHPAQERHTTLHHSKNGKTILVTLFFSGRACYIVFAHFYDMIIICRCIRSRAGWASKDRSTPCIRSRAACASKERSTPEGINMEEHGFRFQFTFPEPDYGEYGADFGEEEECLPRQRKPPEVRNALRQKRVAFRQKTGRHHAKVALRKYNRANNTKFELVEVPVIREFWEFGGGCIHYNFTAKQAEDHHHSADTDSTKLFFSEVNSAFHGEKDVVLCCIVGEHDNVENRALVQAGSAH